MGRLAGALLWWEVWTPRWDGPWGRSGEGRAEAGFGASVTSPPCPLLLMAGQADVGYGGPVLGAVKSVLQERPLTVPCCRMNAHPELAATVRSRESLLVTNESPTSVRLLWPPSQCFLRVKVPFSSLPVPHPAGPALASSCFSLSLLHPLCKLLTPPKGFIFKLAE